MLVGIDSPKVAFAHVGCMLLGTLNDVPVEVKEQWDGKFGGRQPWGNKTDGKAKLASALLSAMEQSNLDGIVLWDTMRKGSDYWRPGKLLTDAADILRTEAPTKEIVYAREDSVCPPIDLLQKVRANHIGFGEYAADYAGYLWSTAAPLLAAAHILMELARGQLSVFYCIDPYVPGYADAHEMFRVPYDQRKWLQGLGDAGCHRVILTEEIIQVFLHLGFKVELLEVDSTFSSVHTRFFGD